ncbi:MAG TPA: hypothetical protein VID74_00565 [Gemmatimonadales bacterium]|jgi:hypothetical protein
MRVTFPVLILALTVAAPATAQGGVHQPPATVRVVGDTLSRRPAPLNYFFRSLAIPGWGQASLDRKLTGALFIGFEGLAISMVLKTSAELRFLDRTDTVTAASRRGERQDWIVLLAFNHLFSGLEAYVSAHLLDFPPDLRVRALPLPGRRTGFGVTVGLPH